MGKANNNTISQAVSLNTDPVQAVRELATQLDTTDSSLIVFFASPSYPLEAISQAIDMAFPDIPVMGCSTAGEITPDGYIADSVTAFSLPSSDFTPLTTVIDNLSNADLNGMSDVGERLKTQLESQTGIPCTDSNTFALLICDGLSKREEILTAGLHQGLMGLPLIGGSAGDSTDFLETWVYHEGIANNNRAAVALIQTSRPFKTFKTEHFTHTTSAHVVTETDPEERIVWEIDAEPAADVYANIVGVDKEKLGPEVYADHPLAVKIAGDIYVRSVQQVIDGKGLLFYCAIEQGIILYQTQKGDIVENLESAFDSLNATMQPDIIIGYDCILRQLEARNTDTIDQISNILKRNHVIGFSTYGEQTGSMHINQTFTGLAIGVAGSD